MPKAKEVMSPRRRFFIGGAGALMPILVALLSIDMAAAIDSHQFMKPGYVIGFGIRYAVLFVLGGVIAWLHEDETKTYKLFQIGIAAPALVTSFVAANGMQTTPTDSAALVPEKPAVTRDVGSIGFHLISSAYAYDQPPSSAAELQVAAADNTSPSFLKQVIQGISGQAYSNMYQEQVQQQIDTRQQPPMPVVTAPTLEDITSISPAAGAPAVGARDELDEVEVLKNVEIPVLIRKKIAYERMEEYRAKYEEAKKEYEGFVAKR